MEAENLDHFIRQGFSRSSILRVGSVSRDHVLFVQDQLISKSV